MNIALITGRSPSLSKKEIEATATILPFHWSLSILQADVVLLKSNEQTPLSYAKEKGLWSQENKNMLTELNKLQNRLGGTLKIALLLEEADRNNLESKIAEIIARHTAGRVVFGVSVYGKGVDSFKTGLSVKKLLKKQGFAARVVPAQEAGRLSTAQISGNKLGKDENHLEVLVIQDGNHWQIGLTVTSQDIESYRKRDFSIPVPDPVSGMLSPKLAQIMINLALEGKQALVYDPFCGNGRIVEEARLIGLESMGSDISQKQIQASKENLEWIAGEYALTLEKKPEELLWVQDATKSGAAEKIKSPFVIATEPYLGKPLRQPLKPEEEGEWLTELQELYIGFFQVWVTAPIKPENLIVVFPKAKCASGGRELSLYESLVDRLKKIGYSTSQVSEYGRPDALVKREIIQLRIF